MVCLVTTLLQFFSQNAAVKNFENRSIFSKDIDKILWLTFLGHAVVLAICYISDIESFVCISITQSISDAEHQLQTR